MHVGQLFVSYCEFITALKAFEKETYVCFSKRDSRKIESIRHKIKYPVKTELEFYEVKFNCIRGGGLYATKELLKGKQDLPNGTTAEKEIPE